MGKHIGEGMHASVHTCYKRLKPRPQGQTPMLAHLIDQSEYEPHPYAVKIVRDNDEEKIIAHLREFEILKTLRHPNIVCAVELFHDKFKNEVF